MPTDSKNPEEDNPYADLSSPSNSDADVSSNPRDQSVFAEPWMRDFGFRGDEYSDSQTMHPNTNDVEHTVWDEPGLSPQLAGPVPDDALTWSDWYIRQRNSTSTARTWQTSILVTLIAGPLAVITAWCRFGGSTASLIAMLVIIPATEELLKVAIPLWIVEKRPHLFCSSFQILLCAACSGCLFGAMRHVFAIKLFMPSFDPTLSQSVIGGLSGSLVQSVVMHTICSAIAGMALVRIWSTAALHNRRPDLTAGSVFGAVAVLLHVAYSIGMMALQLS